MKKITSFILILILNLLLVCCGKPDTIETSDGQQKIKVYTSFCVMYDFTKKIGGDKAEIINLVPDNAEPHDWEPSPNDLVGLETADVFIYNGLGMEGFVHDISQSLDNKDILFVDTTGDIDTKRYTADELNNVFDAHAWLSPVNAKIQISEIRDALVRADSENKDFYDENYEKMLGELDKLDEAYRNGLEPYKDGLIIVSHNAYSHLCAEYGLNQIAIEGAAKDSEPSPAEMSEIIELAKTNNIKYILAEPAANSKAAEAVAAEIGGYLLPLSSLEVLAEGDYFSVMYDNLETLKTALRTNLQ